MLKQLSIQNIALIDNLKVDLFDGLNVLSGETGAGKSIIIDSLSFVLGDRFDKNLIRTGEKEASVSAFFTGINNETKSILNEFGIEADDDLILFRQAGEKNECKINGNNITLSMLKQISSTLVDIHGQGENQRILNEKNQLDILDGFCGSETLELKKQLSAKVSTLSQIKSKIAEIGGNRQERERSLDFLKFEVKEIEEAKLKENEDEELIEQKQKMLAGEKIASNLDFALNVLDGSLSTSSMLAEAFSHLANVSNYDKNIETLADRLKSCRIELNDIVDEIKSNKESLNFSQIEFDRVDARLDKIKTLKKKYGATISDIFDFLNKTKAQIEEIENSSELLEKLENEQNSIQSELEILCTKLSNLRKSFASQLEEKVCKELNDLAMKNAKFKIDFETQEITKSGFDKITFLFSANAGQELKPLGKIISGGEMSRFCLALKNITFKSDSIDTMVFDEVDTGISGKVAEVVAEKMVRISRNKQTLSITHLPQIVAMADACIKVEKFTLDGKTKTSITVLDENGQVGEVARLIGSNMASAHAGEHAKDLISFGKQFKEALAKE